MRSEAPHIIEMRDVRFAYNGEPVLGDVTFSVHEGEFISVVGPNGGGKSTLLKLILGLLAPQSGTVRVLGGSPRRARLRIGYMPQNTGVDPRFPVTVMDVALMGRLGMTRGIGPFGWRDREIAEAALDDVGLGGMEKRPLADLSGGQRQRVFIARALASEPRLLLLDEPTSNLDIHVESEFGRLLKRLNERLTIVMVSHDLGFVSELTSHALCVNRTVAIHPTSAVNSEYMAEIFGGPVRMVRHDHQCPEGDHDHRDLEEGGA